MKQADKIGTIAKVCMVLWLIITMSLQHNIGLADNGDYSRSMEWITPGPLGMVNNFPAPGTEAWTTRFENYWIPYWNLKWRLTIPTTSAVLLWFPGALLNYFFYDPKILYLPFLSLFPKLVLFSVLLLLFKWTDLQPRHKNLLIFGLGIPITLIFTSTDYLAYFNTFYQESASFTFLFIFLASILLLKQRPSWRYLILSFFLLLLLVTTKASNIYWPIIGIPFLLYGRPFFTRFKPPAILIAAPALIIIFTFSSLIITGNSNTRHNTYHSLFFGVLPFSDNPSKDLQRLGIADAIDCVNTSSYQPVGDICFTKYQNQMTFMNTIKVLYWEPAAIFRELKYTLDRMQNLTVPYMGIYSNYSLDDPRTQKQIHPSLLNLWSRLKYQSFPKGYILAAALLIMIAWFIFNLRMPKIAYKDLASVGLLSAIACAADMTVAILGDGKSDIIKHLFLANVLFDIALIIFVNCFMIYCVELFQRRNSTSKS